MNFLEERIKRDGIVKEGDEDTLRKLGLRMTCEPIYPSKELYF